MNIEPVLFSWRNNTLNESFILKTESLLLAHLANGDICTCISDNQPTRRVMYKDEGNRQTHTKVIL